MWWLALGLSCARDTPCIDGDPGSDALYREDVVHTLALRLDPPGGAALHGDDTDIGAELRWQTSCWRVRVRMKGNSTRRAFAEKPSLRVSADPSDPFAVLFGARAFNLHNLVLDPSAVKEALAYGTFRDQGLPAPRTGWAELSIDDEDYGLYAVVEDEDPWWTARWWDDPSGGIWEAEGICEPPDCACLEADGADDPAIDTLCASPSLASMDTRRLVGELATEMALGSWDSYAANQTNYKLVHEPATDLWSITPWSMDKAFASEKEHDPSCGTRGVNRDEFEAGALARACAADADCAAGLARALPEAVTAMERRATTLPALRELLRDAHRRDPRTTWTEGDRDADLDCVVSFVAGRRGTLGI